MSSALYTADSFLSAGRRNESNRHYIRKASAGEGDPRRRSWGQAALLAPAKTLRGANRLSLAGTSKAACAHDLRRQARLDDRAEAGRVEAGPADEHAVHVAQAQDARRVGGA